MSSDDRDSEGLAKRAAGADPRAFDELVRRLRGRLAMWISVRMGPLLRARLSEDDVLQETLLQAHQSLPGFEDQGPGSFQRWLFSVAENRLKDLHKYHAAQKRHPSREAAPGPPVLPPARGPSPSSGARRNETVARVAAHVARLPDPEREVLVMRALEERTFAEIAQALGKPQATVQGLFARALRMLKDEFRRR
jgi:RNA polymerase sigma-70 factor (ECF subfamily)